MMKEITLRAYRSEDLPELLLSLIHILLSAIEGSLACITNDYELNMICKVTSQSEDELLGRTLWLVTTLGAEGALVRGADGTGIYS